MIYKKRSNQAGSGTKISYPVLVAYKSAYLVSGTYCPLVNIISLNI